MTEITQRLTSAIADRYQIEKHIGQGGMATVYLAHDIKHDRKVALKVLRPELAAVLGADRFVQEIKTTANLQHPHILPLFDSGEADSFLYYVMPFIDGETLRDKLNRETQLGIEEAVGITTDIAGALDYAHGEGVIHRDIKPENILIHNGRPMVADFGIALAVSAAAGGRMTETGLSLGTPHYMSPEQATAEKDLTARSDVYSLGSVLYEMLTGEPPHTGASAQAIIMKIVAEDVQPVTALRKSVPPHVAAATSKSLEKLAADRFESAAKFAEALTNPAFTLPTTRAMAVSSAPARGPWKRVTFGVTALAAVMTILFVWTLSRPEPPQPVIRYGIAFPPDQVLQDGYNPFFALAPDGSWLVYRGPGGNFGQLWVKARDRYEASPLAGTEAARAPMVSPDGLWVAFTAEGEIRKVPAVGGSAIALTDSVNMNTSGGAWLDDGQIVFVDAEWRLRRIPDVGGPSDVIWSAENGMFTMLPTGLPGGRGVLFKVCDVNCRTVSESWVLDLQSGQARMLFPGVAQTWYVQTGHLVYVRQDGGVFAVPFDLRSLETRGAPIPLLDGVQIAIGIVPDFALSRSGTLMMLAGASGAGANVAELVWVERDGTATPVESGWTFDPGPNRGWALSPDGSRLALKVLTESGEDIWIKEMDRGPLSRLTFDQAVDERPRWTPDGTSVLFLSDRNSDQNDDIYVKLADGTGAAELVLDLEPTIFEARYSPDGEWIVLRTAGVAGSVGGRDILAFRPGTDSVPRPLLAESFDEKAAALSPDGRWIAYESTETGRDEIYVRPFPEVGSGKWQISTAGGRMPLWAHNGRELFYVNGLGELVAAQVITKPTFSRGEQLPLFSVADFILSFNYTPFDISIDDQRFLMVRPAGTGDEGVTAGTMIVVENWLEELKAKVGN